MNIPTDKQKALESAMVQIERRFGKGSIMKLGTRPFAICRSYRAVPWHWTRRWGPGDFPGAGSVKFSGRKHPAKQP